jgi:23S rRNA (guanosine2251-2'-O)-methyltransferase
MMEKPKWAIERDKARRKGLEAVWLFGLHAVRDALLNPTRTHERLMVTPNAEQKLAEAIAASGVTPEVHQPRKFDPPIDPGSVHQGAVLLTRPLDWGDLEETCAPTNDDPAPRVLLLDRVTDPHNVGAILRSAEVLGARAVIAPLRHAAPETGALAKSASGALERQPYLRVKNLSASMTLLKDLGYILIGLDSESELTIDAAIAEAGDRPIGLVLGAEGPGLREKTRLTCDQLARIPFAGGFGSLNVSNAAAVSLYASRAKN